MEGVEGVAGVELKLTVKIGTSSVMFGISRSKAVFRMVGVDDATNLVVGKCAEDLCEGDLRDCRISRSIRLGS